MFQSAFRPRRSRHPLCPCVSGQKSPKRDGTQQHPACHSSCQERVGSEATPEQRKWLNQAVFKTIELDVAEENPRLADGTIVVEVAGVLAEPVAAVTGLAQVGTSGRKTPDVASHGATQALSGDEAGQSETPGALSHSGGSNVNNLAEREGFEPSKAFTLPLFESGQFNHSCISPILDFDSFFWYTRQDSNLWPSAPQADALSS